MHEMIYWIGIDMLIAPNNSRESIDPRIVSLRVDEATENLLGVSTVVNFTNPTQYSANIPFMDVLMLYNSTPVAHAVVRNFSLVQGHNYNTAIEISWNPFDIGGPGGPEAGRSLASSYISGMYREPDLSIYRPNI